MKKGQTNPSDRQKNQLIPRASEEPAVWFVPWIKAAGSLLLFGGGLWALALWLSVAPPFGWLVGRWPDYMARTEALVETSHFGHAFLGPIELATLGTIILSFVHVFHQLVAQRHMERTRFQPVVTCVAILTFDVEGSANAERIQIAHPYLKLRVRNLGDSPATFIDIQIKSLYYIDSKGNKTLLNEKLKLKSVQIDSLGKHDASGTFQQEVKLSTGSEPSDEIPPNNLPAEVAGLINGILRSGDRKNQEALELTVAIRHENVMQLEYKAEGTFTWSRQLFDRELSDGEQYEFIEKFMSDRVAERKGDGTGGRGTIGQCIKRNQTLQAALKHESA